MYLTVPEVSEEPLPEEIEAALRDLWDKPCENCGEEEGVALEDSRTIYNFDPQEGGPCPALHCGGMLEFTLPSPCTCATSPMPPCSSCTSSILACSDCKELAADHDPNRDIALCRSCAKEHHEYWDGMWAEYYSGRL